MIKDRQSIGHSIRPADWAHIRDKTRPEGEVACEYESLRLLKIFGFLRLLYPTKYYIIFLSWDLALGLEDLKSWARTFRVHQGVGESTYALTLTLYLLVYQRVCLTLCALSSNHQSYFYS